MLIYPSIFTFPLLPLHHWSTTTHPHTDVTTCDHTCTHFIGPISFIWWIHVSQFTCFISIPNMCPPVVQPIMSPCTAWSGTFYSFALDEPYPHFLVCHLYLTCLYLPFTPEIGEPENHPYEFPPQNSDLSSFHLIISPRSISHLHPILHFWLTSHYHTILNPHFAVLHTPWYYVRRPFHCSQTTPLRAT